MPYSPHFKKNSLRILRIIPSMNPVLGGPSQGIRNSIPELLKLGIENEVVSLDEPNESFVKNAEFIIHALGPSKGGWKYCKKLAPWLLENFGRFDVVIVHGIWLYHSFIAIRAFQKFKKAVKTSHTRLYVMPHGMLDPYFQRASNRKVKAIRNSIYWRFFEQKIVNQADGVLFTSEEELLLARNTFRAYKPKAEINVSYGVKRPPDYTKDMEDAFLKACGVPGPFTYLLFLSRIDQKKGVDLLIEAYLQLKQQGIGLPKLVIAGPGIDSKYGKFLQDISANTEDIVFPGMLTGAAKWGAFYGAEAFILPSHQENFGIAVAEALACGKPVLISNKVNIWREIDKSAGGLVNEDTLDGVRSLLKTWGSLDSKEKSLFAERAFHTFEKYFSIEDAAKIMVTALEKGISCKK